MTHPTITIEGAILSAETLERLESDGVAGQRPEEFGLHPSARVKDEIARAWSEALMQWKLFKRRRERVRPTESGATETRAFWAIPLLDTLGYRPAYVERAHTVNGQTYAISHRDDDIGGFPLHIVGLNDSLDKRRETGGPRLSPHGLAQEYLNVTEHVFAIVTNGLRLRLLRDSSRLTRLSYLEFDLEAMMEGEVYPDFAVLFRLIHRSRMPASPEQSNAAIIERYHLDALEAGTRIREGLSAAVHEALRIIGQGLVSHPDNRDLRGRFAAGDLTPRDYFAALLRLVYRLLFLFVIEDRDLVFPRNDGEPPDIRDGKRSVYDRFYAARRLLRLAEQRHLVDGRSHDLWLSLFSTFCLFEDEGVGARLGIVALDGELFGEEALRHIAGTHLSNGQLLDALDLLGSFRNSGGDRVRVNYAALNVEEFGSVYEGLLELDAAVDGTHPESVGGWSFRFTKGTERATTGSHYTPDELVRPLVEHALDPIIEAKIAPLKKGGDRATIEAALLSLKVCDVACGSGHFLLAAARRIGYALARARTDEEQPSPAALRAATRDAISHCIYGVDKNPMAVELCRVALWLESHDPGRPLTFLDHRIKCGDAIVGVARAKDLDRGIPDEAFTPHSDAEKEVARLAKKRNREDRARPDQLSTETIERESREWEHEAEIHRRFTALPEATLAERRKKEAEYRRLRGDEWWRLKQIADLATAQFFLPKTKENLSRLCTESTFRELRESSGRLLDPCVHAATEASTKRRFFHWSLEYPEVFEQGGFDCVLGNPPFLGHKKVSGALGVDYLDWLRYAFAPAGAIDLVGYFFRRIYSLLQSKGAMGCIATNTLAQGGTREGGLAVILLLGGQINYAVRSMPWPGRAGVEVALVTMHKGEWSGRRLLDSREVPIITSYLTDEETVGDPYPLAENAGKSFQGSIVLGKGFVLEPEEAEALIARDPRNRDVLFPYLNGEDLNSRPDQSPSRWVINFFDWSEEKARQYPDCFEIVERLVKPERQRRKTDGTYQLRKPLPERWWHYADKRPALYRTIAPLERVLVVAIVTKYTSFVRVPSGFVFAHKICVLALEDALSFCAVQSDLHGYWARRYSSTLGGTNTLNYSPSDCFATFPFPRPDAGIRKTMHRIDKEYNSARQRITADLAVGLTQLYNLFHEVPLTKDEIIRTSKCDARTARTALDDIARLRELHIELDNAVRDAYGWSDLDLGHGFHEVDFLPEHDRVRFTISPAARREVLRRLLKLNHERHGGTLPGPPSGREGGDPSGRKEGAGRRGESASTLGAGVHAGSLPSARDHAPDEPAGGEPTARRMDHRAPVATQPPPSTRQRGGAAEKRSSGKRPTSPATPSGTLPIGFIDNDDVFPHVRAVIKEHGSLEREELIREVARSLGYERTGKNIRDRIESAINASVRRRILTREGPHYVPDCKTIEDYDRETLTNALRAVLGSAWWPRDQAIRNAAYYLGFQRAGKSIVAAFKSIINGGIRKGVIKGDGGEIRRG